MVKEQIATTKVQVVFELGPVTTIMLIQLVLVVLKLMNYVAWSWMVVFIPIWITLLIITGTIVMGLLYWVTTTFILKRK